ncbi:helix-turn-helix domain-containing protein [Terriglobus saanensis]|uniref:helix-turn-helix domain-containing protein n=1 Tax=Terriglobus saanensis TaxID=870903 RepID=UPI0011867800
MAQTHYLLDAHEAAQILRMDRRTLVRWARLGQVPAHPMGEGKRKLWRFVNMSCCSGWKLAQSARNGDHQRVP